MIEKILQGYSDIADVLPRVDKLKAIFQKDTDFNRVCALIYSDILEFNRRTYKFFRRKAWHVWFAFDWGLFERRFKLILARLSSHRDALDKEAAAAHFVEMKRYIDQRQDEHETFELRRQSQMAREVLEWLADSEGCQEEYLHKLSDDRQPGTCNWILEESQTRSWIEEDCGTGRLWITGIPGAGKSFLCTLVIQHLQTRKDRSTLYYFCGQQSSGPVACVNILRTLIVQLLRQNLEMTPLVHEAFLQKITQNSSPAIRKMFIQILPNVKPAYILIDGIDELRPAMQQEVLKYLIDIQKQADYPCRLLVFSREEPQIKKFLHGNHIKLEGRTAEGLILYIDSKVKELHSEHPELEDDLLSRIKERLSNKAIGMFLWVRLVVAMLKSRGSVADIEHAIEELPEGLDEAYRRVLDRIEQLETHLRQRVFNIFYWLCVAQRPVTVHEVADGIALHTGQTVLNRRNRINNTDRDIVEICAPLLERSHTGVVNLVHFSAKEYMLHSQSGPFVDQIQAHLAVLVSSCINLTACLDLVPGYLRAATDTELESRVVQGNYGLYGYGSEFWIEHLITYFARIDNIDAESMSLIGVLNRFSQACKYPCDLLDRVPPELNAGRVRLALNKLRSYPRLYNLVARCLLFRLKKQERMSSLETVDEQQQWLLRSDETYLTCIGSRLNEITERLLAMDADNLPPNIALTDYTDFASRFKLPCRYAQCHQFYDSVQDRNKHETSHTFPRFPCQLCDFSVRGFRSRKDLEKHIRTYHTRLEDTEIPSSVHMEEDDIQGTSALISGRRSAPIGRSKSWNREGRRAIERSLRLVLDEFEATITTKNSDGLNATTDDAISSTNLSIVKSKIQMQQYDSLADFKGDLGILIDGSGKTDTFKHDIDNFCNDVLEKATFGFPAFAHFDHLSPKRSNVVIIAQADSTETDLFYGTGNDRTKPAISSAFSSTFSTSYWSTSEESEFPALLRRWGRDFIKIADFYQTKTAEDVDEHFMQLLRSGRTDLQSVVDMADADRLKVSTAVEPIDEMVEGSSEHLTTLSTTLEETAGFHQQAYIFDPEVIHKPTHLDPAYMAHHDGNDTKVTTQSTGIIDGTKTRKRRPRPRALCNLCDMHKEGFHDEYAARKHYGRFHVATRKAWFCDDISIDKRFLAGCKPCTASKGYSSRYIASKHLRKAHFSADTSVHTLNRWIRESEVPNPSYRGPLVEPLPLATETPKRQKLDALRYKLPPLSNLPQSDSNLLPPMMTRPVFPLWPPNASTSLSDSGLSQQTSASESSEHEADEQDRSPSPTKSDVEPSNDELWPPDVSFDNMLPGHDSNIEQIDKDGPPHRANRALIQPDQVKRLPHLDPYRKTICLDQVEALHQRLDTLATESKEYLAELKKLASLSQMLTKNLNEWRRHSTHAPSIPYSL